MRLLPNVYEISSHFGDRWIKQYLLVGDFVLLLDAGVASTPAEVIFPYMEKIGLSPARLTMAVALHPDADHHGGLAAIKNASPNTLLACHREDVALIEDPERLYQERYNFLAKDHGLGFGREGMEYCPHRCRIDLAFSGGEIIQLAKDWPLQVWHVPGHSAGHLAFYDERNKAAFTSDAVQTNGYPTIDGQMAFGPTYYSVEPYLDTIRYLEDHPIEHMYSGHWPAVHGAGVKDFLASSREFVLRVDQLLSEYLRQHRAATLKQIVHNLSPQLGTWPQETAPFLQFSLFAHVARMEQLGALRAERTNPVTYSLI